MNDLSKEWTTSPKTTQESQEDPTKRWQLLILAGVVIGIVLVFLKVV